MTTHIITKVYLIWSSSKGGKWLKDIYFNKEQAEKYCEKLKKWAQNQEQKTNFKVEEKATTDCIIYSDFD